MLAANGFCQRLVSAEQLAAVFFQPRQQQIHAPRLFRNSMFGGQECGVLFQPLEAEKLFANGHVAIRREPKFPHQC